MMPPLWWWILMPVLAALIVWALKTMPWDDIEREWRR